MGGYGAMYHYLKNTSKYSACIALSPATRPDHIDESKYGSLKDLFLKEKNKNIKVIGVECCDSLTQLTNIYNLPNSIEYIGEEAF